MVKTNLSNPGTYAKMAILLGVLTAFGPLSIDMYLPGLPAIAREFQTSAAAAEQTLATFLIGLALGQAIYGPLSDRLGRRQPLIFGSALYALASIGCILAPTIQSLVVLRFAQALGGCAGIVITRSIVRDLFDERESARMYSFLMLVLGLAPITAPLAGAQLLVIFGWRAIFIFLTFFGLVSLLLTLLILPETLPAERRAAASLRAVLQGYGRLLADRRYMGFVLAGALGFGTMFAYISGSPFVFIELNGIAPEHYALIFGSNAFGLIAATQFNRWLLARYHGGQILTAALTITATSGLALAAVTAAGLGGFVLMLALLFCCVASMGLVLPNATAAAMSAYGRQAGSASALFGAVQFAVGAGAGAVVSLLHNNTALPMVGTIAFCGVAALLCLQLLALRPLPQEARG